MANTPLKNIFISYRVQDTAGETGRLVDDLRQHFSDEQLFMDIDNIEPGLEFDQVIEGYLSSCEVLLAVIGPRWIGNRENEPARIRDENDWVRLEVRTALKRNIRVIPVLVDGASLPKDDELPDDLKPLLKRQSYELSNKRWQYDVDRLIDFLIRIVGITPVIPRHSAEQKTRTPKKIWIYVGIAVAVIGIATVILLNLPSGGTGHVSNSTSHRDSSNNTPPTDTSAKDPGQSSQQDLPNSKNDVSGTWIEDDPGVKSSFILHQSGEHIKVQVQSMGQMLSEGEGSMRNKNIELKFELLGSPTVLKGILSDDGSRISGTYTMELTNDPQPIVLLRKK